MLGSFGIQVGGFGGLNWRFGRFFGVYVGSCRAQMGFGRLRGHREGIWKGLGWLRGHREGIWVGSGAAGDPDLGPTWGQLEPSWSQLGASMGPT